MRRAVWLMAMALPLAAQSPTTEGITPRSTTERPNVSSPGMDQTLTGLLMDATCSAITSTRNTDLTQMPSSTRTPSTMRQDGQTGANAQSTQGEIARTQTEREQRAMKVYTPQSGPDRASAQGTTGAATNTAPAAGARTDADDRMPRATDGSSTRATAGPSHASATGTTGAATETATPTQSGTVQSLATAGTGTSGTQSPVSTTGERARTIGGTSDESSSRVRDKYRDCMVKPSTTSFAIHADGKLYVLDRASNEMVQEQMRNEAFRASMVNQRDGSQWMTVTVQGTPTSDNTLTIRSVRK